MAALVIYESMYGNTARIAEAIGAALGEQFDVELKSLPEIDQIPDGIDVLVVGGPTYGHTVEAAMKTFLDGLPTGSLEGVEAAAFDTRIDWPKFLSGAASRGIADRLGKKGAHIAIDPESFRVEDKDGPLVAGEVERAMTWGRQLAAAIATVANR
jgi:flavodoxin